jgi:NADP-dependent 3-hydroxy acid dehydrogenase YdfG
VSELKNRVALVTGGSRGIGKAVALALAEAGAAVAINYRERSKEATAIAEGICENGGRAGAFRGDVSLRNDVESIVHDVEEHLGPIDILVNNAGTAAARSLDEITEVDFDRSIAVNLKSAFLCTQAVLSGMRARHWGRIINVSSIGARIGAGSVSVAYGGRHGDGQTIDRRGRRLPHPRRSCRNGRRDRADDHAARSHRLHHGTDDRGERRLPFFVTLRIAVRPWRIAERC